MHALVILIVALISLPTTTLAGHWGEIRIDLSTEAYRYDTNAYRATHAFSSEDFEVNPHNIRLCPSDKDLETARCEVREAERATREERQDLKRRSDEAREEFSSCMREEIPPGELEWDDGASYRWMCHQTYQARATFITEYGLRSLEDELRNAERRLAELEVDARSCNKDHAD